MNAIASFLVSWLAENWSLECLDEFVEKLFDV